MKYAVSLKEFAGPSAVRSSKPCDLLLALHGTVPDTTLWHPTGETFNINRNQYRLYKGRYATPGGVDGGSCDPPWKIVVDAFYRKLRVAETVPVPGTVITKSRCCKTHHQSNILILPDGGYWPCSISSQRAIGLYRSTDRGEWSEWSKVDYPVNFYTLFRHQDALYLMGTHSPRGMIVICRSEDDGRTWELPDEGPGVVFCSKDVIIRRSRWSSTKGRLWRAMETNFPDERRQAFVLSAKVSDDLMKASELEDLPLSEILRRVVADGGEGEFRQWIEGNIVVAPDGSLVNLLRVDEHKLGPFGCRGARRR